MDTLIIISVVVLFIIVSVIGSVYMTKKFPPSIMEEVKEFRIDKVPTGFMVRRISTVYELPRFGAPPFKYPRCLNLKILKTRKQAVGLVSKLIKIDDNDYTSLKELVS